MESYKEIISKSKNKELMDSLMKENDSLKTALQTFRQHGSLLDGKSVRQGSKRSLGNSITNSHFYNNLKNQLQEQNSQEKSLEKQKEILEILKEMEEELIRMEVDNERLKNELGDLKSAYERKVGKVGELLEQKKILKIEYELVLRQLDENKIFISQHELEKTTLQKRVTDMEEQNLKMQNLLNQQIFEEQHKFQQTIKSLEEEKLHLQNRLELQSLQQTSIEEIHDFNR